MFYRSVCNDDAINLTTSSHLICCPKEPLSRYLNVGPKCGFSKIFEEEAQLNPSPKKGKYFRWITFTYLSPLTPSLFDHFSYKKLWWFHSRWWWFVPKTKFISNIKSIHNFNDRVNKKLVINCKDLDNYYKSANAVLNFRERERETRSLGVTGLIFAPIWFFDSSVYT